MTFKLNCPHCNQKLETEESLEIENVGCPNCDNIITIIPEDHTTPLIKKKSFISIISQATLTMISKIKLPFFLKKCLKSKKICISAISLALIIVTTLVIMFSTQEDAKIQYQRGLSYMKSGDYTKSFKWFLKAAQQGHATSQFYVGAGYTKGKGVSKNLTKGFKWLLKSAQQGIAESQYGVGLYYNTGSVVNKDVKEAFFWWNKAARQGHAKSLYSAGICYMTGTYDVPIDKKKGRIYLREAASKGHSGAQKLLQ